MTNKDVIDLRAAGLDDSNLIAAITAAKAVNFDLSPAGLKTLLTGKVSNAVITAMRGRSDLPGGLRGQVVRSLDRVSTKGLTGRLAFDRFGDTENPAFTLYRVQGTPPAWSPVT